MPSTASAQDQQLSTSRTFRITALQRREFPPPSHQYVSPYAINPVPSMSLSGPRVLQATANLAPVHQQFLASQMARMRAEQAEVKLEKNKLKKENIKLKTERIKLIRKNARLNAENMGLKGDIEEADLFCEVSRKNASDSLAMQSLYRKKQKTMEKEIKELKGRLAKLTESTQESAATKGALYANDEKQPSSSLESIGPKSKRKDVEDEVKVKEEVKVEEGHLRKRVCTRK